MAPGRPLAPELPSELVRLSELVRPLELELLLELGIPSELVLLSELVRPLELGIPLELMLLSELVRLSELVLLLEQVNAHSEQSLFIKLYSFFTRYKRMILFIIRNSSPTAIAYVSLPVFSPICH